MKNLRTSSFFLLFFLLFSFFFFFRFHFQNFIFFLSSPFQKILWQGGQYLANFSSSFFSFWKTQKEKEKLERELSFLRSEVARLKYLDEENENLKKALNFKKENLETFPTKIVAKNIDGDFILIQGGEREGIKKGMVLIDENKNLIGKITETFPNFSKVQLVFAKGFKFDAEILNPKLNFLVEGKGSYRLSIQFLPANLEVKEGEVIFTSHLSGKFPPGLIVGRIEKINSKSSLSFLEGEGKVFFDLKTLNNVFVITNFFPWEKK